MFHDANGDGARGHEEAIILRERAFSRSLRFTGSLNAVHAVAFGPTGAAKLVGINVQSGTFTLCRQSAGAAEARQIIISASGRPRVQKTQVATCH